MFARRQLRIPNAALGHQATDPLAFIDNAPVPIGGAQHEDCFLLPLGLFRKGPIFVSESQAVLAAAGPCDGAVFVRPTVAEACQFVESDLCRAVNSPPEEATDFFFVDTPEEIWSLRDFRAWTTPTPLQPGPAGLDGARTIGYARVGNVVVTAAFAPLLRQRSEVTPAELFQYEQTNQALALNFTHPDIAFTPSLALRAALPERLAEEERYLLHFGSAGEPDVMWEGEAGTGAPIEAAFPLTAAHVVRLREGDAVTLTAVRGDDPLYSIELTTNAQAIAVSELLRYMATGLGTDLMRIAPPSG